jgi:hypothetical protein
LKKGSLQLLEELTNTPPKTVAGMRAVIEYLVELDGHSDDLPTLLRSSILRSPVLGVAGTTCGLRGLESETLLIESAGAPRRPAPSFRARCGAAFVRHFS